MAFLGLSARVILTSEEGGGEKAHYETPESQIAGWLFPRCGRALLDDQLLDKARGHASEDPSDPHKTMRAAIPRTETSLDLSI
jgi:hypothetical protein